MMVIWVMMVLSVIAATFAFETRSASHSASAYALEVKDSFVAEAAVQYAITRILTKKRGLPDPGGWSMDGTVYEQEFTGGTGRVSVMSEGGKVDINKSSHVLLGGLLDALGVEPERRDVIVDSIQDWTDADSLLRGNGAEDDYYMSLPNPYRPKNGRFATLEELIMVRGVTPELLYGGGGNGPAGGGAGGGAGGKGLIEFLTVYSANGKIYINSAPREVLMAIPGISAAIADELVRLRAGGALQVVDLQVVLGEVFMHIAPYISLYEGSIYSIEAVGYSGRTLEGAEDDAGGGAKRTGAGYGIKAVVSKSGANNYKFMYWKDRALPGGSPLPAYEELEGEGREARW